jgi:uncharacterized protein YjbJ (UPF0337 family)
MDRQRIEGGLKKTTGMVKEKAGQAIGDRHLETEGKVEKTEGHIRCGVGKAMDAVRDVVNRERDKSFGRAEAETNPGGRLPPGYCVGR